MNSNQQERVSNIHAAVEITFHKEKENRRKYVSELRIMTFENWGRHMKVLKKESTIHSGRSVVATFFSDFWNDTFHETGKNSLFALFG